VLFDWSCLIGRFYGFFFMLITRIIGEVFFFSVLFHDIIVLGLSQLSLLLFLVFRSLLFLNQILFDLVCMQLVF